jgi:malate dehydrogenase (oxaloacetate-decarboxylating)
MALAPSASYSLTVRLEIKNRPGMLGRVASAIGGAGGDIGAVDLVESQRDRVVRDITIKARDSHHGQQVVSRLKHVAGVRIVNISDRTFLMHLGGKIEIRNKVPVRTRDDLSMAYTPGVARVCLAIQDDRERAFALTIKQNSVAVEPTAPPSWAWATSDRKRPCRSWKARPCSSRNSPTSTPSRSVWPRRMSTRS